MVMLFSITSAQMADKAELQSMKSDYLGLAPASKPFGLIDLSRLEWSHSYSISFFSGGGSSQTIGLYTGSIFYEITSNLSLNFKLGIAHNPSGILDNSLSSNAMFLPGLRLDYRPTNNFRITAGFDTYYGNYHYPYGRPYGPLNWRYFTD
jgi:hypothetical protein